MRKTTDMRKYPLLVIGEGQKKAFSIMRKLTFIFLLNTKSLYAAYLILVILLFYHQLQ